MGYWFGYGSAAGFALESAGNEHNSYADCAGCGKTVNVNALEGGLCHACRASSPDDGVDARIPPVGAGQGDVSHGNGFVCLVCGAWLTGKRKSYCSEECAREGRRRRKAARGDA